MNKSVVVKSCAGSFLPLQDYIFSQITSLFLQAGDANDREPASGAEHETLARDDLREGQREEHSHQRHGQRARQVIAAACLGDPGPQYPHVFGPPRSRSISQKYRPGSRSFAFFIKVLSGLI
jgi:hypothetical protein